MKRARLGVGGGVVLKKRCRNAVSTTEVFPHLFKNRYGNAVLKKRCGHAVYQYTLPGNAVPTPNKKTEPNSSNKVSIRLQEFPHWILFFHSVNF